MRIFIIVLLVGVLGSSTNKETETTTIPKAKVSYSDFETLVREVKNHREKRLINCNQFLEKSVEKNVVILDTRSRHMYERKHIKGAIHLNFSDFTQENLANIIPDKNTTILIYCNNNFDGDEINFATKSIQLKPSEKEKSKAMTLALNIPTYINLYGYGYKNVYELSELISIFDARIRYEGTTIL